MARYSYPRVDNAILNQPNEVDAMNAWVNQFLVLNQSATREIALQEYNNSSASADVARKFGRGSRVSGGGGGGGLGGGGAGGGLFEFLSQKAGTGGNLAVKTLQKVAGGIGSTYDAMMGQRAELESSNIPTPGAQFAAALGIGKVLDLAGASRKAQLTAIAIADYKQVVDQLRQESELRSDINKKTTLTGELSDALRDDIARSAIYAQEFGFTMKDMGDIYTDLVEDSGRFALINEKTFRMAAPNMRAFDMTTRDLSKAIGTFEKVGIGANKTITTLNEAGLRSVALGLSGKKVISDINQNIGKLNEYGFQNGVKGLERMAQRANEFRMSMDGVFKIADDVMDPDKALSLSANLQVLGGAIGDFNDPLKLMYMATNNVEGLQDALIGAASNLATYNREQGRFEITGVNLRRAKEMATQLGVSYTDLSNAAIASAERTQAATQLSANNVKANEKQIEFLTNLARMEDGELKIAIPKDIASKLTGDLKGQTEIAVSELNQANANILLENQKAFEKLSPQQIAENQLTVQQQMQRDFSVVAAYYKYSIAKEIANPAMASLMQTMKNSGIDLEKWKNETVANLGDAIKATTIPTETTTQTTNQTGGATNTQNVNYTVSFNSDVDSDRARRAWEEEFNKNPRDFTKFN